MITAFASLLAWLPLPLKAFASGAIAIFFLVTILRIWAFIKDLIPFL